MGRKIANTCVWFFYLEESTKYRNLFLNFYLELFEQIQFCNLMLCVIRGERGGGGGGGGQSCVSLGDVVSQ